MLYASLWIECEHYLVDCSLAAQPAMLINPAGFVAEALQREVLPRDQGPAASS